MINGRTDQFLDTGWFSEATLYYRGYIYWCEAQKIADGEEMTFFIDKWEAVNEDNIYYHTVIEPDGSIIWERILEITHKDQDWLKKQFLESAVFEGKTFWQVEKDIAWLEESEPIIRTVNE